MVQSLQAHTGLELEISPCFLTLSPTVISLTGWPSCHFTPGELGLMRLMIQPAHLGEYARQTLCWNVWESVVLPADSWCQGKCTAAFVIHTQKEGCTMQDNHPEDSRVLCAPTFVLCILATHTSHKQ